MKTVKTVWFFWWGWSPDNMENMLEKMEASGWKLFQVDFFGVRFKFVRGEKEKVRYSVDYQPAADDDYHDLFDEDGWQMKWTGGGWYLWRKAYEGERPEIFTESSSLIERNNRLLKLLIPLFVMLIAIFILLLLLNDRRFQILIWLYVVIITLYVYMIFQLQKFNRKLKNEIRQ